MRARAGVGHGVLYYHNVCYAVLENYKTTISGTKYEEYDIIQHEA